MCSVPQLVCQGLYSYSVGELTQTTQFAMCTRSVKLYFSVLSILCMAKLYSALSVVTAILSYLMHRNNDELIPMQYHLEISNVRDESDDSADDFSIETNSLHVDAVDELSPREKVNFIANRGRAEALSEALAELFEIEPKSLEVGQTRLTAHGGVTHIVHYLYASQMQSMRSTSNVFELTPESFVRQLYAGKQHSVTQIFTKHFGLEDGFSVRLYDRIQRGKNTFNNMGDSDTDCKRHLATALRLYFRLDPDGLSSFDAKRAEVLNMIANLENDGHNDSVEMSQVKKPWHSTQL